jgi:ferritin
MEQSVYELINDQINKELYSSYLYLSFADYYEDAGLDGYANYFFIQAQEERDHALIFRNYLLDNDRKPKLGAIDAPAIECTDFAAPLHEALKHEQYVTSLINAIYAEALAKNDYRACQFLKWFIDEQMEEEDNARDMITKFELFGDDKRSLYELNQQYATRVYTQATPLATN